MEHLEEQVVTNLMFMVKLDMLMKESLVIQSWSNEVEWRVHCDFQEAKTEHEVKMLVDQEEERRLYLDDEHTIVVSRWWTHKRK